MRGKRQGVQSRRRGRLLGWDADIPRMSVIPLTIFFSLLLAGLFIALFAHEQGRRRFASPERDSLLPLADELPRTVVSGDQDHDDADCGCMNGTRPPCNGCLKRHTAAAEDPYPESVYF